jgi:hypothetical protein
VILGYEKIIGNSKGFNVWKMIKEAQITLLLKMCQKV